MVVFERNRRAGCMIPIQSAVMDEGLPVQSTDARPDLGKRAPRVAIERADVDGHDSRGITLQRVDWAGHSREQPRHGLCRQAFCHARPRPRS